MLDAWDYRVEGEQGRAVDICYTLGLDPYDTNANGIERWRVIAIDLAVLRIKLLALGVSV